MEFDEGEKKQEIRHRKRGKIERKYIYLCPCACTLTQSAYILYYNHSVYINSSL